MVIQGQTTKFIVNFSCDQFWMAEFRSLSLNYLA